MTGSLIIMQIYTCIVFSVYFKIKSKIKKTNNSMYKNKIKAKIMNALLDSFNENIKYFPVYGSSYGTSSNIYKDAEFEMYGKYKVEALIKGKLKNKCNFEMIELATKHKYIDSKGYTNNSTFFIVWLLGLNYLKLLIQDYI